MLRCIRHLRESESKTGNCNDSDRNIECIKPTMERRIDLCGAVGRMNLKPQTCRCLVEHFDINVGAGIHQRHPKRRIYRSLPCALG